jgi:chaperonin GroEL
MDPKTLDEQGRVQRIECQRFRTAVIATEDDLALQLRVEELKEQKEKAESEYEQRELELRIGKLTSGIARLTIYGPTAAETREKRDRAEDAWCAIRGAAKYGAVPGGGWTLLRISARIAKGVDTSATTSERIGRLALVEALLEPVKRIYRNWGFTEEALVEQLKKLASNEEETFDIQNLQWVPKFDLLDSAQAVSEAILNSISIAALLGTLGGVVSYYRDGGADTKEREYTREFEEAIK